MVRTIDQQAAEYASNKIAEVNRLGDAQKKKYRSLSRGFAAMVQMNGLTSALAFLKAKGEDEHTRLYCHLNDWIKSQFNANAQDFDVLNKAISGTDEILRLYSRSVIKLLTWLRKYAEAELPEPDETDND